MDVWMAMFIVRTVDGALVELVKTRPADHLSAEPQRRTIPDEALSGPAGGAAVSDCLAVMPEFDDRDLERARDVPQNVDL
jgi:hypothetical protein